MYSSSSVEVKRLVLGRICNLVTIAPAGRWAARAGGPVGKSIRSLSTQHEKYNLFTTVGITMSRTRVFLYDIFDLTCHLYRHCLVCWTDVRIFFLVRGGCNAHVLSDCNNYTWRPCRCRSAEWVLGTCVFIEHVVRLLIGVQKNRNNLAVAKSYIGTAHHHLTDLPAYNVFL